VRLLSSAAPGAAAVAAAVLGRACGGGSGGGETGARADSTCAAVVTEGGCDALVRLLVGDALQSGGGGGGGTPTPTTPPAAAAAASAAAAAALRPLLRAVPAAAAAVAASPLAVDALARLLRAEGAIAAGASSPHARLAAAACLAHLAPCMPDAPAASSARSAALPAIVRLLRDADVGHDAADVLADLLAGEDAAGGAANAAAAAAAGPPPDRTGGGGSPRPGPPPGGSLRARASDAGAVEALCDLVAGSGAAVAAAAAARAADAAGGQPRPQPPSPPPPCGGALRALASLCGPSEAARSALAAHAGALPAIVTALDSPAPAVRAAACACVRAATRSARALRIGLADAAPGLAAPLVRLLDDPDPGVRAAASAALCNVVLDFSPAKAALLEAGALPALARLASSPAPAERLNAAWALQNLAYHATSGLRPRLLAELPWPTAAALAADGEDGSVRVRALNLLQNLFAHAAPADAAAAAAWGGESMFEELGWRVREAAGVLAARPRGALAGVDLPDNVLPTAVPAGNHRPGAPAFRAALLTEVEAFATTAAAAVAAAAAAAAQEGGGGGGGGGEASDEEGERGGPVGGGTDGGGDLLHNRPLPGGGASAAARPASAPPATAAAAAAAPPPTTATTELRHAVYALSNAAATGGEVERWAALRGLMGVRDATDPQLMTTDAVAPVLGPLMRHPDPAVRLAVSWLVVNLAAPLPRGVVVDGGERGAGVVISGADVAAASRMACLVPRSNGASLGAGCPLVSLLRGVQQSDPAGDVRSRARAAADRLEALAAEARRSARLVHESRAAEGGEGGSAGRGAREGG